MKPEEYAKSCRARIPDARGGHEALQEGRRPRLALRLGKIADDFNVANKVYEAAAAGRRLHRRLAVEGGAREVARAAAKCAASGAPCAVLDEAAGAGSSPRGQRAGCWAGVVPAAAALWCAVSYVPFLWHPMVRVDRPGRRRLDSTPGMLVERAAFDARERRGCARAAARPATRRARQPGLPAGAARGGARAGTPPSPRRPRAPTSRGCTRACWHSIQVIFWGFLLSSLIGVPLGHPVRRVAGVARLTEPFIEFFRYLPAPAFGALAVAVLGIDDAPKIAIIFIGTFFQQVLVVANTTRRSTRRCSRRRRRWARRAAQLLTRVVVPGVVTDLYTDMRVLLGWAWTYLIVAELIGVSSGHHLLHQPAGEVPRLRQRVRGDHPDRPHRPGHRPGAGVAGRGTVPVAADGAARAGSRAGRAAARAAAQRAPSRRRGAPTVAGAPRRSRAHDRDARAAELPRAGAGGRARASRS